MALTETRIKAALKAPPPDGKRLKLADDHGLYLLIDRSANAWWRLRITLDGREKHGSLGTYSDKSLDAARAGAAQGRVIAKKEGAVAFMNFCAQFRGAARPHRTAVVAATTAPVGSSFADIADAWTKVREREGLAASTLECDNRAFGYLRKELGDDVRKPMAEITWPQLRAAILRIRDSATLNGGSRETAKRAMKLVSMFWRYAMTHHSERVTTNPVAGFRIKEVLGDHEQKRRAAITDPKKFGELLVAIDGYVGQPVVRLGLQVLALTFVRPGELRLAKWSEFDLDAAEPIWRVPQERMKSRESDHLVPLATQTVALLRELKQHVRGELAFPSLRPGQPLSDNTFNAALRTLGYSGDVHVAHGFRGTADTLLHERGFNSDVIEQSLAHKRPGVESRYNRSHLLAERRPMMQAWADYLDELRQNHS